jgi:hypothetical protein
MYVLRSLAMRVLLVSATLMTIWVLSVTFGRDARHSKRPYFKPTCDGLSCRNTNDCGTRCNCVFSNGPLGVCIAKPQK